MVKTAVKGICFSMIVFMAVSVLALNAYCEGEKLGYVDLRQAFYEYGKTKIMEDDLAAATEKKQDERTEKVKQISKIRDEAELLTGDVKTAKQEEINKQLAELQEFDRTVRQELLNEKNEMFREVIEDIQKVVVEIGKKENYDYILDSRNIMYAKEQYDLTEEIIKQLNAQ
ncbi:MAG: OmpH family outer membrane protein [Candidatus Omnitrophota bacterium]